MSFLFKRGKVYWYSCYINHKLYRQSLKTKDRSTALYLKNKLDIEKAEGKSIIPRPDINALEVLEEYQRFYRTRKTTHNYKGDESYIRKFLGWGNIQKLNQITSKRLQDYLNYRIEKDKISLNTANHIIAYVKWLLNFAVENKYIAENPIKRFKKYRLPENDKRFLSEEEKERFMGSAKDTSLYPAIATAIYAGLRKGEVASLEWSNIDFERNIITVKNKAGFTTKSKKTRVIPLHTKILKPLLLKYKKDSDRCFNMTNERRIFNRIRKQCGLTDIDWKALRRTFASHLVIKGVSLFKVGEWLGHADPKTTKEHYARLAPKSDEDIDRLT